MHYLKQQGGPLMLTTNKPHLSLLTIVEFQEEFNERKEISEGKRNSYRNIIICFIIIVSCFI